MIRPGIRIASPCSADWNKMQGDDRVRHCADCNLNVYNFSAMTDLEVERLIAKTQGRLCARIYRRADGTILTQNCPVGLRARIKKISRIAGAALSAAMSVGGATAQTSIQHLPVPKWMSQRAKTGLSLHVKDFNGAILSYASVSLRDKSTNHEFDVTADSNGEASFDHLLSGDYSLLVSSPGFRSFRLDLNLRPGEIKNMDAALNIEEYGEMGVIVDTKDGSVKSDLPELPSKINPVQTLPAY